MTTRIDLGALQRQLDAFEAKFGAWAQRAVAGAEALRDGHLARLREFQGLASESSESAALQAELGRIQEEQARLPALVQEVADALEAEAAAFARQEAALSNQEALKERKLGALHQALAWYQQRLGLAFEHGEADGEQLRVVLTQVDPRQPERPFCFAVRVAPDNTYVVEACEPAVPGMAALLAQLNSGGSFSQFVRCMRREFQAGVRAEAAAPAQHGGGVAAPMAAC